MPKLLWGILIFIGAVIIICLAAFMIAYFAGSSIPANEKQNMVNYLNSKYDKDFSINDISVRSSGLGGTKTLTGKVTLDENSSLKFEIWREDIQNSVYSDSYLEELWSLQAGDSLTTLFQQIGDVDRYIVRVGPGQALYKNIQGSPSFSEIKSEYPSQFGYNLALYDSYANSDEPSLSDEDLRKVLLAINFINEQNADHKELKFFFKKNSSANAPGNYTLRVELEDEELDAIHTIDDLNKYVKVEG